MNWKLQGEAIDRELREKIAREVVECGRFTMGRRVEEFENAWSARQDGKFCVMCSSGSNANLVMLRAVKECYGLPDGCGCVVPAVTWGTTIAAVVQAGMRPVFVDVELKGLSFDFEKIEREIDRTVRVVFVTHVLGFRADMERLKELARFYRLVVVEDCCETGGMKVDSVGSFSFYWGHHMTTIEGGMVVSGNKEVWKMCLMLRDHGLSRAIGGRDFEFLVLGYNVRPMEISGFVGLEQLGKLDEWNERRRLNYQRFVEVVGEQVVMKEVDVPMALPVLRPKLGWRERLEREGVETRSIIGGNLLRHPAFARLCERDYREFEGAEVVHGGFYIGNNQFLKEDDFASLRSCLLRE